jgi:hypothetical protein
VSTAVGFATLSTPLRGAWPFADYPEHVQIIGRNFRRSDTWAMPMPHVAKQYREDVDRQSMHLEVLDDGTWEINHIDEANPERGLVLEHTVKDVIQTPWGAALLTVGVVGAVAAISYALTR